VGSPQIFEHEQREAEQSINFITCHDGFTLNDLVSYNSKHNEANGEENRDGANDNRSWNCGAEGPTDDQVIEKLRNRQVKNFLTVTVMSLGTPMLLMGDEVRRTQGGNNNSYCHDSDCNWFDWTLVEKHADVHRFARLLCSRRTLRGTEEDSDRVSLGKLLREAAKAWNGVKLNQPDWGDGSLSIALAGEMGDAGIMFYLILNAYWEPLTFELPVAKAENPWRRWIDTSLDSPNDIVPWQGAPAIADSQYQVRDRSVVMLYSRCDNR
jgi:glycogen operon protein